MAEAFLGTGWALPIQADDTGGIRMRSREEDIREAVGVILGTRLGERVMRAEFGTALGGLVFDPNDACVGQLPVQPHRLKPDARNSVCEHMTYGPDLSAVSDRDIVRSARAGREDAYGELVRRYRRRVLKSIYRIVHHAERTNDLAQETFIKAFGALDRYRSERRFQPWILTIATNTASDYVRRKRPDRADSPWAVTPRRIDAERIFVPGPTDTPAAERHRRDAAAAVRRALKRLKPKYRRCVTLRYVHNRSYEEIARLMGVSVGTVGTYLHRAREDLRRMLENHPSP